MEKRILFTSDTHFHHGNVIRYCDRPWAIRWRGDHEWRRPSEILGKGVRDVPYDQLKHDVIVDAEAMNREMVRRWNETVRPFDVVYHLGDFAMGPRVLLEPMVKKLNGYKILVRGNHDRSSGAMREAGFDEVHESLRLNIDGVELYMHHQPEAKTKWRGATIHLCGHVHEKWRRKGNMINVGVDQWDFTPRSLQELLAVEKQGEWPKPEEME
jgi:calcineurin-like phosphoesterase family protein